MCLTCVFYTDLAMENKSTVNIIIHENWYGTLIQWVHLQKHYKNMNVVQQIS